MSERRQLQDKRNSYLEEISPTTGYNCTSVCLHAVNHLDEVIMRIFSPESTISWGGNNSIIVLKFKEKQTNYTRCYSLNSNQNSTFEMVPLTSSLSIGTDSCKWLPISRRALLRATSAAVMLVSFSFMASSTFWRTSLISDTDNASSCSNVKLYKSIPSRFPLGPLSATFAWNKQKKRD